MTPAAIIIVSDDDFKKFVVEKLLALEAAIEEKRVTQEKIDQLTAQIEANRNKLEGVKDA